MDNKSVLSSDLFGGFNRVRRAVFIGMVVIMAMSGISCSANGDRIAIAKEALEEKYNETFEVMEVYDNYDRREVFNAIAYSDSHPDILLYAKVAKDGSYVGDNYLAKVIGKRIADAVDGNMGGLLGASYIYVSPFAEDLQAGDASISIEEYVALYKENKFTISIYYAPERHDADYVYNCLSNAFEGLDELSGYIVLHIIDEENLRNMQEYIESHAVFKQKDYQNFLENETKIKIEYENGRIDMMREEFVTKAGAAV